ncbi:MAG: type I polyketide synthase, partial [Gammaproteobacteria bacterium]|nr:type I polyketide synthase [Gammaproteobacteria bacterium]
QVVEAHGTGTELGDPIEYDALTRSFRKDTEKSQFCAIGSVKTNIGHTATAAGVAGVLKLLLSLRHRQIPPSLHFREGNPAIDFDSSPFYVNTQLKEWKMEKSQLRRAAVSSFGFSGTNAHLVIEEAPLVPEKMIESPGYLVVLSARTSEQLKQHVRNFLSFCRNRPKISMNDLSYTLFVGRMHMNHRFSCIARSQEEMIRFMEKWCEDETVSQIYCSEIQEGKVREQASLKNYGNQCIEECRNTKDGVQYLEHLATIADLFIQGYSLEFHELFSRYSKKISLPPYPFARERYWIPENRGNMLASTSGSSVSVIHPLLHENTSDLSEQCFTSTFTGKEFFLNDHRVKGEKVLPGVVCLEMARAAVEKASGEREEGMGIHLRNVVWSQPIVVNGSGQKVHIGLYGEDSGQIQFEV